MFKKSITLTTVLILSLSTCAVSYAETLNFDPRDMSESAYGVHSLKMLNQGNLIKKEETKLEKKRNKKQNKEQEENVVPVQEIKKPIVKATIEELETKGVYISSVEFSKSAVFTNDELNKFRTELVGQNLFFSNINSVIERINHLYAEKGYITAKAIIPEQTVENGNLQIYLIEGKVDDILVVGNKWTKSGYITKRIDTKPNKLFKISALEQELLQFNRANEGVKLKANLNQGKKPETTEITLVTEEKVPFHFASTFDNAGRSTIGLLRAGLMLSNDSLFGHRDRLTIGTYLSKSSVTPYADYNIPINKKDGRLGFVFSSSDARITDGNYQMFNIESKSRNYSLYLNQPLIRKPNFQLESFTSLNYKKAVTIFDANPVNTDNVTSAQTGLSARFDSKRGIWYASQNVYQAFPIASERSKYFKAEGNLVRLHDFGHGIIGQFRGMYQWSPNDVLPYVDQFQSGGIATTRGYTEGLLIGKTGYLLSGELIFPIAPSKVKIKDKNKKFLGKWVKGVFFVDDAGVFPFKGRGPGAEGITSNDWLASIGPGLRVSLPGDFVARLYWGFPMINNNHEARQRTSRFHFELSMTPDFDKLLKMKKRKELL